MAKARRTHFERLYGRSIDPWNFQTSPYEREKYASTVDALDGRQYRNAVEVGCSIGVLSAMLAKRCDRFLGVELNAKAARLAQERLSYIKSAQVLVAEVPKSWPRDRYDLVVLSEVLYFLSADEIERVVSYIVRDLEPNGDCVLVNWLGNTDTGLDGEAASALFRDLLGKSAMFDEIHLRVTDRYELRMLRIRGRKRSHGAASASPSTPKT